jgi:hypothetical protein
MKGKFEQLHSLLLAGNILAFMSQNQERYKEYHNTLPWTVIQTLQFISMEQP